MNVGNDTVLQKSLTVQGSTTLDNGASITGDVNVNGGVTSTSPMNAPAFHQTSDYRLKDHVKALNNCLDTIMKLKPSSYTMNGVDVVSGLIAHEVQEHVPNAVQGNKDGANYQTVDYIQLIPHLIGAIQEQQKVIERLVKELNGRR